MKMAALGTVAFGAEEMGILGSKYMAEHLPFEASSVNAMINSI
ncbi:MAG: hypothetical protein R2744_03910 [Bacteroidales bacterium]